MRRFLRAHREHIHESHSAARQQPPETVPIAPCPTAEDTEGHTVSQGGRGDPTLPANAAQGPGLPGPLRATRSNTADREATRAAVPQPSLGREPGTGSLWPSATSQAQGRPFPIRKPDVGAVAAQQLSQRPLWVEGAAAQAEGQ